MKQKPADQAETVVVGLAQIAPVWLDREETMEKMLKYIDKAADKGCRLVVFGEALLPGYPFWVERTDGARFDSPLQKEIFAFYMKQSVQISSGDLVPFCERAAAKHMAIVLGCIDRAADRGGHSLYCTLVYIDELGQIRTVHRKLMPTYEERLVWAQGDGHGLKVHRLGPFTLGGLNCWENWMPLARAALYTLGEDLHVAIWPGSQGSTGEITRFIARESRSYVVSVSGLMRKEDISADIPHADEILAGCSDMIADGGSCVAGPDGSWLIEPVVGSEALILAELDHEQVRQERQNFDPSGHYARPDVTKLFVNRERQKIMDT